MRYLDEDMRVLGQRQQQFQLLWMSSGVSAMWSITICRSGLASISG